MTKAYEILKSHHWTVAQLNALYVIPRVSEATYEYFWERAGIFQFDAGLDELTAMNLAHLQARDWVESEAHRYARELRIEIPAKEMELRKRGADMLYRRTGDSLMIQAADFALGHEKMFTIEQIERAEKIVAEEAQTRE